jgi:hypothetical protein
MSLTSRPAKYPPFYLTGYFLGLLPVISPIVISCPLSSLILYCGSSGFTDLEEVNLALVISA